jgi:hypothetical protein
LERPRTVVAVPIREVLHPGAALLFWRGALAEAQRRAQELLDKEVAKRK